MEPILIVCGKQEKKNFRSPQPHNKPFPFKFNSCTETLNSTWRHFRHLGVPNDKTAAILVPQTGPVACTRAQGWRSGENTRLPPMWPGFRYRRRHHMWVEFVVRSHPKKTTRPNSNSIWNARTQFNEFSRTPKCYVGKQQITIKKKSFLRFLLYQYVLNMAVSHVSKNAP